MEYKDLIAMINDPHEWPNFFTIIRGDKDSSDMLSGLQDLSHPKSAK